MPQIVQILVLTFKIFLGGGGGMGRGRGEGHAPGSSLKFPPFFPLAIQALITLNSEIYQLSFLRYLHVVVL